VLEAEVGGDALALQAETVVALTPLVRLLLERSPYLLLLHLSHGLVLYVDGPLSALLARNAGLNGLRLIHSFASSQVLRPSGAPDGLEGAVLEQSYLALRDRVDLLLLLLSLRA